MFALALKFATCFNDYSSFCRHRPSSSYSSYSSPIHLRDIT